MVRWPFIAIVLLLLSEDMVVGPSPAFAAGNSTETLSEDLAQERRRRKRRKKRRKKPPPAEEFAPMQEDESTPPGQPLESVEGEEGGGEAGADGGDNKGASKAGSVHAAHEGAADEPYAYEVALSSDFSITKRKSGENTDGTADYALATRFLWILGGSFELGAQIDFSESSVKVGDETLTTRRYGLAPIALFNFGKIDEDAGLLYAFLLAGITGGSIPTGTDSTKYSGFRVGLGFGYRYFMDTNVAFFGEGGFDYGSEKVSGAEEGTTVTVIRPLRLGFTLFL